MIKNRLIVLLLTLSGLSAIATETPHALGYTFPDEWELHRGTMMIFPAQHGYGWKTKALRREFTAVVEAIAENESVEVFCYAPEYETCKGMLGNVTNVTVHPGDYRIDWARDNAPMIVQNAAGELAAAGFRFNGWGGKYDGREDDADTRDNIARAMGWPIFHSEFVLEGGSIEIGGGIGAESCVINPNRTDWSKADIEAELRAMLGLDRIIWIQSGLMPDPITDGHVDGLLKFVAEDTVLLHTTGLKSDINYGICQDAKTTLLDAELKVIELRLMDDMVHMNFYIGSGGNIAYVPVSGDRYQDEPALAVIRELYDEVVTIKGTAMAAAGGGIHCYTQQIPE